MPSASNTSNSSNIRSNTTLVNVSQQVGSRLVVTLSSSSYNSGDGIGVGDVIRYSVLSGKYVKSKADSSANSEVFGIVERVNTDASLLVVTYGAITIPADKLINLGSEINYGGNDVYFLSDTTAGKLQNLPPTTLGNIVKPVYQIAPTTETTGVVMNYVGYTIINTA